MPALFRAIFRPGFSGTLLALTLIAGDALAQDALAARFAKAGRIVLGTRDAAAPVAYLDDQGGHIGYHMDVCQHVVEVLKAQLGLPQLRVVTVPTNLATRFALLNNRTIDIDCGDNPIKPSSLSQALFSHATLLPELGLMIRADTAVTMDNLNGKSIGLETGSSAALRLRTLGRLKSATIKQVLFRSTAEAFAQLTEGSIDAVAAPIANLIGLRQLSGAPARFRLLEPVLLREPVGLMFRLEDEELHALANDTLSQLMKSGEMARLYDRWFTRAIPGLNAALGLPMPAALRELFNTPGSEITED